MPAPGVIKAIQSADLVVFCPSNPWVSLDPILSVSGIKRALLDKVKIIGVSPIIGGTTLKGPAAKMYTELGISPSALAVANHYQDILTHFIIDRVDASLVASIQNLGLKTTITNTIMKTQEEKIRLAKEVLEFGGFSASVLTGNKVPREIILILKAIILIFVVVSGEITKRIMVFMQKRKGGQQE